MNNEWQYIGKKINLSTKNNAQLNLSLSENNIILPNKYTLWSHDILNKNWDLNSYKKICTIDNIASFWKFINNIDKIGYKHLNFYLMKENVDPMWEHPCNKNGGICSFKASMCDSIKIFEDISVHLICGKLNENMDDINGVSLTPRSSWCLIKIWNKDKSNDITLTLNKNILNKYRDLSMMYIPNNPNDA
jgi:hypothetical protein